MKKVLFAATAIALCVGLASGVQAQNAPAGTAAPGLPQAAPNFPAKAAPVTDAPQSTTAKPARKRAKRMSMQQRFDAANTAHDGHLTRAQATAANWTYVIKHFDVMDTTHKGYVTIADIHAYGSAARAARAQRKAATPAATAPATSAAPATTAPGTTIPGTTIPGTTK